MDRATVVGITSCAASQRGLITVRQLQALGVRRPERRRLVHDGWLEPATTHVYGLPGAPASFERDLVLGCLCIGPDAVVSHFAAARLHRLGDDVDDLRRRDRDTDGGSAAAPGAEFTVLRHRRNVAAPFPIHSTGDLPPADRTIVGGHPCTSVARTVLDLAGRHIGRRAIEALVERAVSSGACDPHQLSRCLAQFRRRGRPGVRRLDAVLVRRGLGDRRTSQRRFLTIVREAGLPRPRTLDPPDDDERDHGAWARLSFSFDDLAVVVEVTSGRQHRSSSDHPAATSLRDEPFGVGSRVYTYTWSDVRDHPGAVATTLRTRLLGAGWGAADASPGALRRVVSR